MSSEFLCDISVFGVSLLQYHVNAENSSVISFKSPQQLALPRFPLCAPRILPLPAGPRDLTTTAKPKQTERGHAPSLSVLGMMGFR